MSRTAVEGMLRRSHSPLVPPPPVNWPNPNEEGAPGGCLLWLFPAVWMVSTVVAAMILDGFDVFGGDVNFIAGVIGFFVAIAVSVWAWRKVR